MLLPSSSIFPAADFAADHRMYLPFVAFSAAVALMAERVPRWVPVACGIVLLLITWARMPVWASDRALWTEAVQRAPRKVRPILQLSRASGDTEALELLDRAGQLEPNNPDVPTERGRIYLAAGQPAQALSEFGRALALNPNDAHALNNRGVALQKLGQAAAAHADFERALRSDPCLVEGRRNLGLPPCPPTAR